MPKKQKDGRYRAKIKIGVDQYGEPVYKWASGKTTRELEENKAEIRRQYIDGISVQKDMLFGTYCVNWYEHIKKPDLRSSTQRNYAHALNTHILPAFGDRQLRSITASELRLYMKRFAGRSKTEIMLINAILYNVFTGAFADGILSRNPAAGLPLPAAAPSNARRALTDEETDKYLATIPGNRCGLLASIYYYTGVRRGEGLGIQLGDIDFDARLLHIQREVDYVTNEIGPLKTSQSDRYIPIPPQLMVQLYPLRDTLPDDAFLVHDEDGSFLTRAVYDRMWLYFMIDAGIAVRKPTPGLLTQSRDIRAYWSPIITPHYLRHNYATLLFVADVRPEYAMRLLGHSSYRTTIDVYTHISKELLMRPQYRVDRIFTADYKNADPATWWQPLSMPSSSQLSVAPGPYLLDVQ